MEFFDCALELVFLPRGEIEHFFCIVQEDCPFGFGLRVIYGAGEDADFGVFCALFGTVWFATKDHAFDDFRLLEGAAHYLDNADIVDVEILGDFREDSENTFGDHASEEVFAAGLF